MKFLIAIVCLILLIDNKGKKLFFYLNKINKCSFRIVLYFNRKQVQNDSDDDDDLSEEEGDIIPYQTASLDSGLESDMEVDTIETQSNGVLNSSQSQAESDSDENDSAVLIKKRTKSKRKSETVTEISEKLDKVKVFEEKVTDTDLKDIFSADLSWFSSSSTT